MKKLFLSVLILGYTIANSQTTIYNGDETLIGNRTVSLKGKNLNFLSSTLFGNLFINGQTGFVGIGTTSPLEKLDVNGNTLSNTIYLNKNLPNGQVFSSWTDAYSKSRLIGAGYTVSSTPLFQFIDFPTSNLNSQPMVWLGVEDRNEMRRFGHYAKAGGDSWFELFDKNQSLTYTVKEDDNNVTMLLPKENSFFGIGTQSFVDGSDIYRLSVNGAIRAHRVKVYTTWADFVFEKEYKLPTLEEVEGHIKEKGHLKDIPSAKEVEENGIELGEMNKRLLQKVEELTLYVIELNKEVKQLKAKKE